MIEFLPYFPIGLIAVLPEDSQRLYGGFDVWFLWFLYTVHGLITLLCFRRKWFYFFYGSRIVILAVNVVGCHQMLADLSHIH